MVSPNYNNVYVQNCLGKDVLHKKSPSYVRILTFGMVVPGRVRAGRKTASGDLL